MTEKVDGIVDRCGPSLVGHGDHGFHGLLMGSNVIYWSPGTRGDGTVYGRPTNANDCLVSLTCAGGHVNLEVEGSRGKAGTLRNWTLEARLPGNPERDVARQQRQSPTAIRSACCPAAPADEMLNNRAQRCKGSSGRIAPLRNEARPHEELLP